MRKEFVMRGQTASGTTEVLNFSGFKPGMAYRLTEFSLYASNPMGGETVLGTITAGKTGVSPEDPNFNNEGLIATCLEFYNTNTSISGGKNNTIINDTFLITQNLILMVQDSQGSPINWQCRFVKEKMAGPEEAAANYKQYLISDGS